MSRLDGKTALITGGGSGIGKAIALAFANEGADVCIIGRSITKVEDTARQIKNLGRKSLALRTDVSKISDIDDMVNMVIGFFGKIDILVNNAGVTSDIPVLDVKEEQWDAIIDVDLKGMFFTTQRVLPFMLHQGKGKIINIASPLGIEGVPNCSLYCTAKGGVISLTRALAMEFAPKKINVNALAPGFTRSSMTEHITSDPKMEEFILRRIPLGRLGRPEEITGAAIYLASDESDFATGAVFFVDGGETAQ
jgi:NAD(P)-dependent dehydrogenase (short-subunit alcohol dehydrogenase family)